MERRLERRLISIGAAAALATAGAIERCDDHETTKPKTEERASPHETGHDASRRADTGRLVEPDEDTNPEHPEVSGEDLKRKEEHAPFKHTIADKLTEALPKDWHVSWRVATREASGEWRPEYDEFIDISDSEWNSIGSVYPDEETGELTFHPSEELSSFYSIHAGKPLQYYTFRDPTNIKIVAEDIETLRDAGTQYNNGDIGKQDLYDVLEESRTITTADIVEDRRREEAEAAEAKNVETGDTG